MKRRFMTLDVFTSERFGGNPLAVVFDAQGLDTATMQRVAAEFNLSETTFVVPPSDSAHTANVRIFTPRSELAFAGHPNIGTAFALASLGTVFGRVVDDRVVFEETAGLVPVDIERDAESVVATRLAAPGTFEIGGELLPEVIADACSLNVSDIVTTNHVPLVASRGVSFAFAELASLASLASARPRADVFRSQFPAHATGIHLYVHVDQGAVDIRCRMFAPLQGIEEDPATGSANVILTGLLADLDPARDRKIAIKILQGEEMGRPSLMFAEAYKRDGTVTETWIGGSCVVVMEGNLDAG